MGIFGRQSKGHGRTVCHRGGGHFRPSSPKAWPYSAATGDFTNFEAAALLHAALLLVVGSRYFLKGGQWAFSADSPKDIQCRTVRRHGGGHFRPGSPKAWPYSAATGDFTNFEAAALLHAALLLVVGSRYFLKGCQWAFSAGESKGHGRTVRHHGGSISVWFSTKAYAQYILTCLFIKQTCLILIIRIYSIVTSMS